MVCQCLSGIVELFNYWGFVEFLMVKFFVVFVGNFVYEFRFCFYLKENLFILRFIGYRQESV